MGKRFRRLAGVNSGDSLRNGVRTEENLPAPHVNGMLRKPRDIIATGHLGSEKLVICAKCVLKYE